MKTLSLLAAFALAAGCSKARSEDAASFNTTSAPSRSPVTPAVPVPQPPAGWKRLVLRDLDPPIAASLLVPEQSWATSAVSECRDVDGTPFPTVEVTIGLPDDSRITLSTCPDLGFAPTRPEVEARMGASTLLGRDEVPTGEWAMSFSRVDVFTKIRSVVTIGWSPRVRVVCSGGSDPSEPPDARAAPRDRQICTSVAPEGAPLAPTRDPAIAYPGVRDPEVFAFLARVQYATSRDDVAAFVALVDPANTMLRDTIRGSKDDLWARRPDMPLHKYLLLAGCGPNTADPRCRWIAQRHGKDIVFVPNAPIHPESTPRLVVRRTPDGWRIADYFVY